MTIGFLKKRFATAALLGASLLLPSGLMAQEPEPFNAQQSESRYFGRSDDPVLVFTAEACTKDGRTEHAEIWVKMSRKDMLNLPNGGLIPRGALSRGVAEKWKDMVGSMTIDDIGKYAMPSDDFKQATAAAFSKYAASLYKDSNIHYKITVSDIRMSMPSCASAQPGKS